MHYGRTIDLGTLPTVYTYCMQRLQLYLTDVQRELIAERARDSDRSQAEVVREILDRGLGIDRGVEEALAAVDATAGMLREAPDWPDWLAAVRARPADERLRELGL